MNDSEKLLSYTYYTILNQFVEAFFEKQWQKAKATPAAKPEALFAEGEFTPVQRSFGGLGQQNVQEIGSNEDLNNAILERRRRLGSQGGGIR